MVACRLSGSAKQGYGFPRPPKSAVIHATAANCVQQRPYPKSAVSWFARLRPHPFTGESLPCALCGGRESIVVGRRDRWFVPLRNVLCCGCGLVFLDPMPRADEIASYYRDEYCAHYHGDPRPRPKALLRDERGARERMVLLAPLLRKGDRVLDIGAGTGAFVAAANAAGWLAEGVEPNREFAAFGTRHHRVRVHSTLFEDAPLAADSFDLITSSHVFEHLRRPNEAFARVHRLLRPAGHFHILVPDIADPLRTPSARWHFGHAHGFTRQTLAMLAWKTGFELLPESPPTGAHLLLRRLDAPQVDWMRFPGHAQEMRRHFAEHTAWRHFASATPYRRFFERMARFRRERRALRES